MLHFMGTYVVLGAIYLLFAWAVASLFDRRGERSAEQEERTIRAAGLPYTPARTGTAGPKKSRDQRAEPERQKLPGAGRRSRPDGNWRTALGL